jgi:hypothetical protein
MRMNRLAVWPHAEVSWKRLDGELIMGIALRGDPDMPKNSSAHCWQSRAIGWKKAALFKTHAEIAREGYRVGMLMSVYDARLATEVCRAAVFAVPIGNADCEVFITDVRGERSLPLRKIGVVRPEEREIGIPLF